MKGAWAFCFVCILSIPSLTATPKLQTGSRVPGLTLRFEAHDSGKYKFTIHNGTGHAITALDILFVPTDVTEKNGRFACRGRCSNRAGIGSENRPILAAGATLQPTYDESDIGSAVIIEAAVFDDASYAGSERAAAAMVATQLGKQAEFDRITSTIEGVFADSSVPTADRAAQLDSTLAAVATNPDSTEIESFYRWFPNIRDCSHLFTEIITNASAKVRADVQASLQPLFSSGTPAPNAVEEWWKATQQTLANFGCKECAAKLANASPPVRMRTVSIGCSAPSNSGMSATQSSLNQSSPDTQMLAEDDPGSDDSSDDETADSDSGNSTQTASDDSLSTAESNAPVGADGQPAVTDAATMTPPKLAESGLSAPRLLTRQAESRCLPMAPRPMHGFLSRDREDVPLRPVLNDFLYPRYFRYVSEWQKCIGDGDWPEETVARYPDPYPSVLNDDQRETVLVIADDWIQSEGPGFGLHPLGSGTSIVAAIRAETWAQAQQGLERREQIHREQVERANKVELRVHALQLALGKKVSLAVDAYAHDLYQTVPGRAVREPLPERAMLSRYLNYIALMDKFASNQGDDGRAAAKARADEQSACGLNDDDERILRQEADAWRSSIESRRLALRDQRAASTTAPVRVDHAGAADESNDRAEPLVEKLQTRLSKASFDKVTKRMHALYDSEGLTRVVPADDTAVASGPITP